MAPQSLGLLGVAIEGIMISASRGCIVLGMLGVLALASAEHGLAQKENVEDIASALLDRYVAAVNAHDTSTFGDIHAENYIQHSGRSPSGLAAQIENFRTIFAR